MMSSYSLRMELAAISCASFVVLGAILYSSTTIYSNVSRDHPALAHPPGLRLAPINLFLGPQCKWRTPVYDVPKNIDFHKTVVAGFPSEEKNAIHLMEALIGFESKSDQDFEHLGMSNHPLITTNYPHHDDGIWSWKDAGDQVILMIKNIRTAMIEYHDILWDISHTKTWVDASLQLSHLYSEKLPIEEYLEWRDSRLIEEIHWYGWFIDYWMEGGLKRDVFTHKITTSEHWDMLMMPKIYTKAEVDYNTVIGSKTIVPTSDFHCVSDNGQISTGCEPIAVISFEKLQDEIEGPDETRKIAGALFKNKKMARWLRTKETWTCLWEEVILNKRHPKALQKTSDHIESEYHFSVDVLQEMIDELNRLISKYSSDEWQHKESANRIVDLLIEHRSELEFEIDEVRSGERLLTVNDFLGPKERQRRRKSRNKGIFQTSKFKKDYSEMFRHMERLILDVKQRRIKSETIHMDEQRRKKTSIL